MSWISCEGFSERLSRLDLRLSNVAVLEREYTSKCVRDLAVNIELLVGLRVDLSLHDLLVKDPALNIGKHPTCAKIGQEVL